MNVKNFNGEISAATSAKISKGFHYTDIVNAVNAAYEKNDNGFMSFSYGRFKFYVEKNRWGWGLSVMDTKVKTVVEPSPMTCSFMWGKEIDTCVLDRWCCNYIDGRVVRWSKVVVDNIAYKINTIVAEKYELEWN